MQLLLCYWQLGAAGCILPLLMLPLLLLPCCPAAVRLLCRYP